MNKKVWIFNHYAGGMMYAKGGRHYNFAKYLRGMGYEPTVFCCNQSHGDAEQFIETDKLWVEAQAEEIGVPFVFVRGRDYVTNGVKRVLNMLDFYFNAQKAAKEYAKLHGKPDVIYASSVHPLTLVAGIRLARRYGIKCVCEVRDLWPETFVSLGMMDKNSPFVRLLRVLEKRIYRKADRLIFTVEGAYDYILERGWDKIIPREKVFFINNGVDLEAFDENCAACPVDDADLANPDSFKVVYTGSIRRVNALGLLLDVAKCVKDPRVRFLIWGDGDERAALEKRVQEEHIDNVVFKGFVAKKYIPYIVSHADLNYAHNGAAPVFRFGISFNKIFDYLAGGKPILCDFPCPYNPVTMSGAGLDVPEPSCEKVAAMIEQAVSMNSEDYEAMGRNARQAAVRYSFDKLTEKLSDILSALM